MIISHKKLLEVRDRQEQLCTGNDYQLGFSDGSSGFGLILNQMHNPTYLRGYNAGLNIWIEKIEYENQLVKSDPKCGF